MEYRITIRLEPSGNYKLDIFEYSESDGESFVDGATSFSPQDCIDEASAIIKRHIDNYEPPQSYAQRTMVISAEDPDFA